MKKIIIASALTALLIGCNKDKKAEAAPASSAAEAKASVFTVSAEMDIGGGEILKTCQSYSGQDTAAYRKIVLKDKEGRSDVKQVFSQTPCPTENLAAKCLNSDTDSLRTAKEDLYLYKCKSAELTKEVAAMLEKDCSTKLRGTFTKF